MAPAARGVWQIQRLPSRWELLQDVLHRCHPPVHWREKRWQALASIKFRSAAGSTTTNRLARGGEA